MMQDARSLADTPPHRSRARLVLGLLAVAGVAGALAWTAHGRRQAEATAAAAASANSARVTPVVTSQVAKRDVPVWLDGLGNIAAFYTVTVKSQVDGRIDRVLYKEGQHVHKGDVLVQVDPRPFAIQLESAQAALARDQANLKNARLNLGRFQTLTQQNLIAVQQLTDQQASVDQLEAQLRADQAQIDASRLNLDFARITSPIDGVTGVRLVDPGNIVHAADTNGLVVVTQLDPIALFFTLPEDDLPAVQKAMAEGQLTVQALSRNGDQPLGEGKLEVIDNTINQATATARLKAILANPQSLLWPNQFVKARLKLATRVGATVMPAAAVQHGPQGTFVYVVGSDSTATMRPVTVDVIQGETAILQSGVNPGEVVVIDGQAQLRPGARVSVSPAHGAASASGGASASRPRPSAEPSAHEAPGSAP